MTKQDLLDAVSPDMDLALSYIRTYGKCDGRDGIKNILSPWARNKRMLWNLLGKQLTREFEVKLTRNPGVILGNLSELYTFRKGSGNVDITQRQKNPFVAEYIAFFVNYEEKDMDEDTFYTLVYHLLDGRTLTQDSISIPNKKLVVKYKGNKVTLQTGMKPMRALGKIVGLFGKDNFPNFEKFRLGHSTVMTGSEVSGTLVLSIHPLDYFTMSDNGNDWGTCMSWTDGCYRVGTLETMNSNNMLVAYLKSKDNWVFNKSTADSWNNKSWRNLICVNKDIIMAGKSYPYTNDELTQTVLETVRQLAAENLSWTYQYGPQEYMDMQSAWTVEELEVRCFNPLAKTITFRTEWMYNDALKDDEDTVFWCVRNKVNKSKIISCAGKVFCLDCGKRLEWDGEDGEEAFFCYDCFTKNTCSHCGHYMHDSEEGYLVREKKYCEICLPFLKMCPDCNEPSSNNYRYIILSNEGSMQKVIAEDFPFSFYWRYISGHVDGVEVSTCEHCYEDMVAKGQLKRFNSGCTSRYFVDNVYPADSDYVRSRVRDNWEYARPETWPHQILPSALVNA